MNKVQAAKLSEWEDTADELKILKSREMRLRKELFEELFPVPKLGVNNLTLNEEWILQGTAKETKKVDQEVMANIIDHLSVTAADKAIKITYSINYAAFDFIDDNDQALLLSAVTTKPAAPTLKISKPKR